MRPTIDMTPRSERTLDYYFAEVMETVISVYQTCVPELDRLGFMEEVYGPLQASRVSGDNVLGIFHERGGVKLGKGDLTLLACIYCLESGWARVDGNIDLSWSLLLEAQHHVTTAKAEDYSEPQLAMLLDFVRTEAKSNAGRESVAHSLKAWWDTRQEAIRLFEEGIRGGKQWASIQDAAREILPSVRAFLKSRPSKKQKNFTSATPEDTVADWLQEVPSVRNLFPK